MRLLVLWRLVVLGDFDGFDEGRLGLGVFYAVGIEVRQLLSHGRMRQYLTLHMDIRIRDVQPISVTRADGGLLLQPLSRRRIGKRRRTAIVTVVVEAATLLGRGALVIHINEQSGGRLTAVEHSSKVIDASLFEAKVYDARAFVCYRAVAATTAISLHIISFTRISLHAKLEFGSASVLLLLLGQVLFGVARAD